MSVNLNFEEAITGIEKILYISKKRKCVVC